MIFLSHDNFVRDPPYCPFKKNILEKKAKSLLTQIGISLVPPHRRRSDDTRPVRVCRPDPRDKPPGYNHTVFHLKGKDKGSSIPTSGKQE
jgi:hypothetical protein